MSLPNETENGTIRKSPEGKDNDALRHEDNKLTRDAMQKYRENNGNGNHQKIGNDISTEIYSTSNDNGKINVQVTVLVGEASFSFFFFYDFIFLFLFLIYNFVLFGFDFNFFTFVANSLFNFTQRCRFLSTISFFLFYLVCT